MTLVSIIHVRRGCKPSWLGGTAPFLFLSPNRKNTWQIAVPPSIWLCLCIVHIALRRIESPIRAYWNWVYHVMIYPCISLDVKWSPNGLTIINDVNGTVMALGFPHPWPQGIVSPRRWETQRCIKLGQVGSWIGELEEKKDQKGRSNEHFRVLDGFSRKRYVDSINSGFITGLDIKWQK